LRQARILSLLLLTACSTALYRPARYRIVAYVRGVAEIHRIGAEKLTHINYAFALVNPQGEVYFQNPDAPAHLAQLQALKMRNPRLRLLVSVGGWGADNFSDAALTEESRAKFAASAIDMVKRYSLDGIDLDWEYPGQPGPGIKYRPGDKQNFTLLLKAMREALDRLREERKRAYALTIASSAGEYFKHTEMDKIHVYLDWINIMTYDFYGSWSKTTGHHTALYDMGEDFVQQHIRAGIPRKKIVLGAAFYGRGWTGVNRENSGVGQPFATSVTDLSFSRLMRDYTIRQGFRRFWDKKARAPFLWNEESGTFISYDDPQSLREKARFVRRKRLGGIMYWEHSHDPQEILLDVLVNELR
jgi:chitinase